MAFAFQNNKSKMEIIKLQQIVSFPATSDEQIVDFTSLAISKGITLDELSIGNYIIVSVTKDLLNPNSMYRGLYRLADGDWCGFNYNDSGFNLKAYINNPTGVSISVRVTITILHLID